MPIDGKYGTVTLENKPGAPADEPVFVLRAQDFLAPIAVYAYADAVEAAVGGTEGWRMASVARERAQEMVRWRNLNNKGKLPDGY